MVSVRDSMVAWAAITLLAVAAVAATGNRMPELPLADNSLLKMSSSWMAS